MADVGGSIRAWYSERLREFTDARYQLYLSNSDANDELNPKHHELSPAAEKVQRDVWPLLPAEVREAAQFYYGRVEAEDWGSVGVYRVPAGTTATLAVRVTTDGDDGWLEVYDLQGQLLGAGRTYIELIAWAPREEVREQFGDNWPEALDRSKTLWQPPESPPPEPQFQPGQAVECRWQSSWVWYPATVTQAEVERVEVEFDDRSREWIEADYVRESEVHAERPVPRPDMATLSHGDRVEFQSRGDTIYFPATVIDRRGSRLMVRQDDGEEEWTTPSLCRPPTPDEPEAVPPLAVGDYVDYRWRGGSEIYRGWIIERTGDAILIVSEEGLEERTTPGKCRRQPEPPEPAAGGCDVTVGDRVECLYQGGKTYYPGKIAFRRGSRILVDYDDGSREWTGTQMCRRPTK